MFYNIQCYLTLNIRIIITKGDTSMTDTLLNNMERINVVAELLYDLLAENPRAQVLAEIIIEASTTERYPVTNQPVINSNATTATARSKPRVSERM